MSPEFERLIKEIDERERNLRLRTAELFTKLEDLLNVVRRIADGNYKSTRDDDPMGGIQSGGMRDGS